MIHATLNGSPGGFRFDTDDSQLAQYALLLMGIGNDDFSFSLEPHGQVLYLAVELEHEGSLLKSFRVLVPQEEAVEEPLPPFELQVQGGPREDERVVLAGRTFLVWEVEDVLDGLYGTSPGMSHITINNRELGQALEQLGAAWLSVRGSYAGGPRLEELSKALSNAMQAHSNRNKLT